MNLRFINLSYGCDPEVFAIDNRHKAISPALLERTKQIQAIESDDEHKHPVFIKTKEFLWIMDGVAFELTLRQPHTDPLRMFYTIQESLSCLQEYFYRLSYLGSELEVYRKPVVDIEPNDYIPYLEELPIYQGFIFGCDRDFDAIDPDYNCKTIDVATHLFRYGGGHWHFGGDKIFHEEILPAIKLMAICVGNYFITKTPNRDMEKIRGEMYGRPGRYRPQRYPNGTVGIEYRSLSNSWLDFSYEDFCGLFTWSEKAYELLNTPALGEEVINSFLNKTVDAMNTANKENSQNILDSIK